MLRLAIQALKSQPCNAGFVDVRNALPLAGSLQSGGAYRCDIRRAFARRGLGQSASQGSTNSNTDNVVAFNPPVSCDRLFASGFGLWQRTQATPCLDG